MFAVLLAAAALAAPGQGTPFSDGRPPARYQGSTTVVLEVTDQAGIDRICHPLFGEPPAGMKTEACQTGDRMVLPNPCTFPASDRYAALVCHELGHANGWSANHDPEPTMAQGASAPNAGAAASRPRRR